MKFIKYQKVRNSVLGSAAALFAGIAAFFGLGGDEPTVEQEKPVATQLLSQPTKSPAPLIKPSVAPVPTPAMPTKPTQLIPRKPAQTKTVLPAPTVTAQQRYTLAMELAVGRADASGKGKDVLGPSSPWKFNLYDDDKDGRYDRGKLDTNRDDVDDEKWNFKQGRWEKDNGQTIWLSGAWVSNQVTKTPQDPSSPAAADPTLKRYQTAMQIANGRADRSGKGKDVLGSSSPWKLNLYDDDIDGVWDRGKLDRNRDDVDDEKWNFKKGRWEKDGGAKIWNGSNWAAPGSG